MECPSFMRKDEASEFFGISAGGPMCARYGWILGFGDSAMDAAVEKYSENCASRGNEKPIKEIPSPSTFGATYTPRPELLQEHNETVPSCSSCVNFDETAHACAAIGKTLFPERLEIEADDCPWAKKDHSPLGFGPIAHEKVNEIFAHLTGTTTSVTITQRPAVKATRKKFGTLKWPNQYESDAPVAEEDKEMIRAYRLVDTRKGPIYLPIFHTSYFGDRAELIPDPNKTGRTDPSLYIDHTGLLEKFAVNVYKLDMNLMMVGEPGTGKSEGAEYIAWMMNMPFSRLPYNEESEPDQYLGYAQFGDTGQVDLDGKPIIGTYFKPGLLPQDIQLPGILLSDEINLPQEAIQQAYRSLLDSSRVLVIDSHRFYRHDYCFHLSAINPAHDFRNIGARPMASADSSRWTFHQMTTPSAEMIRKVLTTTVRGLDGEEPDAFLITTMIKIGDDLRAASRDGRLPDFWTLRQDVKVARMVPYFGLMAAYATCYTDFTDTATKELMETCIRSHTPSGVEWAD